MIFVNKRERFWYYHRAEIVTLTCMIAGAIFGIIGRDAAKFEKINGVAECRAVFETVWESVVFPLAVIVLSRFIRDIRSRTAAVSGVKIAMTLIGVVFGFNSNIHLDVFPADLGVLFFIGVDLFIIIAVYKSTDPKMLVIGATAAVIFTMIISGILVKIRGDFETDYASRMLYIMLYYFAVCYVVNIRVRRAMRFSDRDKTEKLFCV